MTTQQRITIQHINDQHEAQRFIASQASREVSAQARKDAALERAGELAQLGRLVESRRVLALNYFVED
jgi:hypothetical protein